MNAERIDLRALAPQPWKNGAGLTREIAWAGASATDFDWRVSLAEVDRDGPFSAFPGIDRCIALWRGAGMRLRSADGAVDHALTVPLAPFNFAGELRLEATLAKGACSDFNVMTRRGAFHSEVQCVRRAATVNDADATLIACSTGHWRITADTVTALEPMQALLWRTPVDTMRVEPTGDAGALLVVRLCHDRGP